MTPAATRYRFGYAVTRPDLHGRLVIAERTRLDRILGALSDTGWAVLVAIAPALPIVGALAGFLLFRAFAR